MYGPAAFLKGEMLAEVADIYPPVDRLAGGGLEARWRPANLWYYSIIGIEPPDLGKTLAATPDAKARWNELTPIARRDFTSWIESAKQPETRKHRVEVACSKLVAGERRP
jgi:hypothetical protein